MKRKKADRGKERRILDERKCKEGDEEQEKRKGTWRGEDAKKEKEKAETRDVSQWKNGNRRAMFI